MTMLVAAGNFLLLYVFWEAVGLCSYLLIGFWYERPAAAAAGKKAFLVNRVGDFGFALALMLIWIHYGTLDFFDTAGSAGVLSQTLRSGTVGPLDHATHLAICLLLLAGACGKSAQVPLHVWLPDAMEGPTPVSALIHAATMVTAGVYLLARCAPLFSVSPAAEIVVAGVGCTTLILAAAIALTETDLKRILAYSTISQLGYMFLAVGTGTFTGITAGLFHLLTHAYFKSLLFLGAGSVMHAMGGVIDIRRLGGLRHLMPVTCATFLVGCLAIAGIWPFAGFFSKDAVLFSVFQRGAGGGAYWWLAWTAVAGGMLTSIYMFRALYLTFFGRERIPPAAEGHAHESPWTMTGPLIALAVGSLLVGWIGGSFGEFLAGSPSLAFLATVHEVSAEHTSSHAMSHSRVAMIASLASVVGIALASYLFLGDSREAEKLARWLRPVRRLTEAKFFFDAIYSLLVVRPGLALARWCDLLDRAGLDRMVDGVGRVPAAVARPLRRLQSGVVSSYSLLMILGLLALAGLVLF
jgi:NADH-quinone oxidoreductase subunit L